MRMSTIKWLLGLVFILQLLSFEASAYCPFEDYKRRFITEIPEGLYEVQDFYPTGEKKTDSFLLTDKDEAMKEKYSINTCIANYQPKKIFIEGKYTTYFKNDKKQTEGFYKNNLREGVWINYFENGSKQKKGIYRNGVRVGVWIDWYETGEKRGETNYQNDNNFIGNTTIWNQEGLKIAEGQF